MATIESDIGTTHKIEVDGMAFFGIEAITADIEAEASGRPREVIHMDLGGCASRPNLDESGANPDN